MSGAAFEARTLPAVGSTGLVGSVGYVGRDVIADYADELRRSLAGRDDVDDLVDEVVDHLLESAARFERAGMDPAAAAEESVARFGDRELVARAYRSALPGGTAAPSAFTRTAGVAGLLAAGTATLVALLHVVEAVEVAAGRRPVLLSDDEWFAMSLALFGFTAVLVLGLGVRTGAMRGLWALLVLALLVTAFALFTVAWWALPYWGTFVSLAALAVAARMDRRGVVNSGGAVWAVWLLVLAWPVGWSTFAALDAMGVGPLDVYGDSVVAFLALVLVTVSLLLPAAFRLGWWLAREATHRPSNPLPVAPA